MIEHDTIHGMQYTATLTDAQFKTIMRLGLKDDLSFHIGGMVSAIQFEQYEVTAYTFRKDGSYVIERRDFDNDGWDTEEFEAEE